jgi:hypothetical protein
VRILAFFFLILVGQSPIALAQSLDQQERCAQQARRAFQEIQTEARASNQKMDLSPVSDDYQSHGKCLMLVETTTMLGSQENVSSYLMDANERREYAFYVWISRQGKKYWEVPPTSCDLTPSLREKKTCKDRDEFDAFVAGYMEE